MPITLSKDDTARAIASIRRYFAEEIDQELGELPARLLLNFILTEIGPSVYNAAIADAQVFLRDRVADLEGACYTAEFQYWAQKPVRERPR
ncbi:MAG TPA: DUF2164 domain-containing protein [Gemmatimonadaceae bacterium]|nr:DUF2164 domain-containing protein [Gemmatimonadaceae bacterium]